jgi:hypothetical protein
MTKTTHHAFDDRRQAIKYVLRLLSVEQARQLEDHLAGCERCSIELAEVTRFFELLRSAINTRPVITGSEDLSIQMNIVETLPENGPKPLSGIDMDKMMTIFCNCFAGFQRLRKNIAARIGPKVEAIQIDQAAIEILLALPSQVIKMEDPER